MLLRITKNTGKPNVVLYKRDNGSETWMKADDFFVRHDLSHFAVEKKMGYKTAFMGMLNSGIDIQDFENREKRKQLVLTQEACNAENMANLFLIEMAQGNFEDFNQVAASTFPNISHQYSPPTLATAQIEDARMYVRELIMSWNTLAPGETMTLTFEI